MRGFDLGRRRLAALPLLLTAAATEAPGSIVVMTGLPATFAIARALARGTAITITPAFPGDVAMADQAAWLTRRKRADFQRAAQSAAAVIGIRKIWSADPLFIAARGNNIRAVEIDASAPFATEMAGVALLDGGHGPSPFIWLSLTNVVRMTDIVAGDLRRLSEADAAMIERNQLAYRTAVLVLKAEFDRALTAIDDPSAVLLDASLAYLLGDMDVRVAARYPAGDFDWDDKDIAAFDAALRGSGARAVLAAVPPQEAVRDVARRLGARIEVLDRIDSDLDGAAAEDGLLARQRRNLERLLAAVQG